MAAVAASRGLGATASPQSDHTAPPSTHPFTCNSCQVAFRSGELQRSHMRSDWHRYNLKRRVASLPPLSSETFAEKVLSAQASSTAEAAKAAYEKVCTVCQKTYYSANAYQNHLGSQKHRTRTAAWKIDGKDEETTSVLSSTFSLGEPTSAASQDTKSSVDEDSEVDEEFSTVVNGMKNTSITNGAEKIRRPGSPDPTQKGREGHPLSATTTNSSRSDNAEKEEGPVSLLRCLFCNYDSPTLPLNINHMEKIHGTFIPEQEYLVDLEGLIGYLHARIHELHECLYCGKVKGTIVGVQTHMRDKGHCMIAFETDDEMLEVGQFYDFRSTYSDEEDDDDDSTEDGESTPNGVKLGARRNGGAKTTVVGEDGEEAEGDGEGEGWETDSSASSLDSADLTAVPLDPTPSYERLQRNHHHSHHDPRPHLNADGFHSHAHTHTRAVYHDEYELHLPSGRTAGHRSLARYYRQNLHDYPAPAERAQRRAIEDRRQSDSSENEGRGRQLISRANGGLGMIGVNDAKKREVAIAEKKERKREQRARAQYEWGVNKRGNNQKHFRDPLLQ